MVREPCVQQPFLSFIYWFQFSAFVPIFSSLNCWNCLCILLVFIARFSSKPIFLCPFFHPFFDVLFSFFFFFIYIDRYICLCVCVVLCIIVILSYLQSTQYDRKIRCLFHYYSNNHKRSIQSQCKRNSRVFQAHLNRMEAITQSSHS